MIFRGNFAISLDVSLQCHFVMSGERQQERPVSVVSSTRRLGLSLAVTISRAKG